MVTLASRHTGPLWGRWSLPLQHPAQVSQGPCPHCPAHVPQNCSPGPRPRPGSQPMAKWTWQPGEGPVQGGEQRGTGSSLPHCLPLGLLAHRPLLGREGCRLGGADLRPRGGSGAQPAVLSSRGHPCVLPRPSLFPRSWGLFLGPAQRAGSGPGVHPACVSSLTCRAQYEGLATLISSNCGSQGPRSLGSPASP